MGTILSNNRIKAIKSLSQKKFRDQSGLFIVEGEKMVAEALASEYDVVEVYRKEEIGEEAMSRISLLSSPSPVLAVVRQNHSKAPERYSGLCLALDGVRDPGNLGTIIRLSDWFGVDVIYTSADCVEIYNPKVVQATMGAIFRKKVVACNLPEVCAGFKSAGLPVYGTFLDGEDIYAQPLSREGLIVMGNESEGVSAEVASLADSRLYIPSFTSGASGSESLNVAIATAITLSEFRRR